MTAAVMLQGTGSNVGKSLLVAGLARAFARRGLAVRPFKPQNMSNNAAVTACGGEIGRAQALQALACGIEPTVDMNPVLLKPETDRGAQVILRGRRLTTVRARDYAALKPRLLAEAVASFRRLAATADLVLVEGAGSPAEINLRAGDLANMGFAEAAGVPVILAGDIDRGGVIAQLVGTHAVLPDIDRARIKGFLVNRFRGDPRLFDDGYLEIARRTGWQGLGVVPWFDDAHLLPAEDAADFRPNGPRVGLKIAYLQLSRIANFDDLDPLRQSPGVSVEMVPPGRALPGDADLVILPGTKSTRGDLAFLRAQGWDIDLRAHVRRGGRVLGLCGGYQLLGRRIADPQGIEGDPGACDGLGLLDVETEMRPEKHVTRVEGRHLATGRPVAGYEIHIGRTTGPDCARPVLEIAPARTGSPPGAGACDGGLRPDGATSHDGLVSGTYVHGIFASDAFRAAWLAALGAPAAAWSYGGTVDRTLDRLADHLEPSLRLHAILDIARRGG